MFIQTKRFFTHLLLGSMIFTTAFGGGQGNGNNQGQPQQQNPIFGMLGINQENIQQVVNQTVHAIINSLNNQQNSDALVNAIGTLFNSSAQVMQQQFGQGGNSSQAMQAFLNAIAQNIGNLWRGGQENNQGAGRQALNQFFTMIQDALRDGGEVAQMINNMSARNRQIVGEIGNVYEEFGNLFTENGQGRRALGSIRNAINDTLTGENGIYGELWDLTKRNAWKMAGIATVGYLGMASAWFGSQWFWNTYMKWWFKKPRVIIESSKSGGWFGSKPDLPDMVFAPQLKQRLDNLVNTTKSITTKIKQGKKNVKYRNLLLWGPPGTGKTMFAKQLAQKSDMEWVMVTGSSFFQKNAGITAIDELFRWAAKSRKGLLIFIDEADSLVPDRNKLQAGTENYQIVNHFLNYLGERSQKFMVVMSTNHKTVFDSAMQRRIDDLIHLPLPGQAERAGILKLYRDKELLSTKDNSPAFINSAREHLDDNKINQIAQRTNGLSNGDLSGIINTIVTEAGSIITPEVIDNAVQQALQKHHDFNSGNARVKVRTA